MSPNNIHYIEKLRYGFGAEVPFPLTVTLTQINILTARESPHYSLECPAKEPSVQDTLNKPRTPHQDAMRDSKSPAGTRTSI